MHLRTARLAPCCLLFLASLACGQVAVQTSGAASPTPPPSKRAVKKAAKLFKRGGQDLDHNKLQQAQDEFAEAMRLDPTRIQYKAAFEIARAHIVTNLVRAAEKDRASGRNDAARNELQQAHLLDPDNPTVRMLLTAMLQDIPMPAKEAAPIAIVRGNAPELQPRDARQSFHHRGPTSSILHEVLQSYGITPMIDDSVRQASIRIDLDDASYADAAESLKLLTGSFFVPLDTTHVIVAKDTRANHTRFDRILTEDVSVPGTAAKDMADLTTALKSLFDLRQISISQDRGRFSFRAPEAEMDAINKTIADLVEEKGELLLEMRLYSIDKQRTTDIGIQPPTSESVFNIPSELNGIIAQNQSLINQLISAGLVQPGDLAGIAALLVANGLAGSSILGQPFAVFGGGLTLTGYTLGQATANLQLNQSETRELDVIQIRLADQDTATLRSGTRFPVITGSYSGLAAPTGLPASLAGALGQAGLGGANAAAVIPPQIQYEDLGLTLKATPRVDRDGIVHIALDFKIEALAGQAENGIPILASRQFTSNVSAKDGDSVMIMSTLSRQESNALTGVPGLSEIPGLGYSTNKNRQFDTTDLVFVMTPHIVRRAHTTMSSPMITIDAHN